jgi:hypothetical protein
MNCHRKTEVMIRNIELICLINTNDQTKCELSVSEKHYFSLSILFVETDSIFEKLIEGSDSVFVLKMIENSESQMFLDHKHESEEEREMIASEMEDIREFLQLSGGSRSEDS